MDLQGGWFRDPVLIDTVGRMKKWSDVSMRYSRRRVSHVAVISAPESEFYLGYRQTPENEAAPSVTGAVSTTFKRSSNRDTKSFSERVNLTPK